MIDLALIAYSDYWYLVGLVATDGNLSRSGRTVAIVAKDRSYLEAIVRRLGITNKIGLHPGGWGHMAHKVQITSAALWQDLRRRGLTPEKSLTIAALDVPDDGFAPFFRGVIDGDGSIVTWVHSGNGRRQWAVKVVSGSEAFLRWLSLRCTEVMGVTGAIHMKRPNLGILKFGKLASQVILRRCYVNGGLALERKRVLALRCLSDAAGWDRCRTIGQVAKLANAADS